MADAVDWAHDRVAALDHAVDAHERVLLATIVVHQLGTHARSDAAQIVYRAAAAADIENAPRNGGLDGLVAGFCAGAGGSAVRGPQTLLPALTFELLLEIGEHALGGTCPFASNG